MMVWGCLAGSRVCERHPEPKAARTVFCSAYHAEPSGVSLASQNDFKNKEEDSQLENMEGTASTVSVCRLKPHGAGLG